MGLASYTPPNDGTEIKAKHLRDLWIALSAQVNGNLDGNNFANGAIDYAKLSIAAGEIDGDKLTDNSIPTAKYEDSSVMPEHLLAGTGTDWVWRNWTPTWTNLTVGNGTYQYNSYCQVGNVVIARLRFTLGTTSSIGGTVNLTLPVTPSSDYSTAGTDIIGQGNYFDTSGAINYPLGGRVFTAYAINIFAAGAGGTYLTTASVNATVPVAFATGDVISLYLVYEAEV